MRDRSVCPDVGPASRVAILRGLWGLVLFSVACAAPSPPPELPAPVAAVEPVRVTILHINDVYEITPVEGGRAGGLARVATVHRRLAAANPNLLFTLGGDFFSPSALGTAVVEGERLAGRQMVAVLNAAGLDVAVFGNHEFDLRAEEFLRRLEESRFAYVATNVTDSAGAPFPKTARHRIHVFRGAGGQVVRIGVIGSVIPDTPQPYVRYLPWFESLRDEARLLRDSVDILVALTHLTLAQDARLAGEIPELDLILGGHEHENWLLRRGPSLTPIVKADANVRTVAVVDLAWDPAARRVTIEPRIIGIGDTIPDDPEVGVLVREWTERGYAGFRALGFDPERVVSVIGEPLDGLEASTRNRPTNLSSLIAAAYHAEGDRADLALVNTGSIRIDDVLPPGPVTEYDLIRVLPFGGDVVTVTMTGSLLRRVLEQGEVNRGSGGYLAHHLVARTPDGGWRAAGAPLDDGRVYRVALSDFLVSGRERGLDYLTADHPDLEVLGAQRDVRLALRDEMMRRWGAAPARR
jgi:5'-nucleotidase / UDP-sugar diphosphatase